MFAAASAHEAELASRESELNPPPLCNGPSRSNRVESGGGTGAPRQRFLLAVSFSSKNVRAATHAGVDVLPVLPEVRGESQNTIARAPHVVVVQLLPAIIQPARSRHATQETPAESANASPYSRAYCTIRGAVVGNRSPLGEAGCHRNIDGSLARMASQILN